MVKNDCIKVALAQIAPVWINRDATIDKVKKYVLKAATEDADLVVFGESILPGYPFWLDLMHGSEFNSDIQKEIHAHYLDQAISVEDGDLDGLCNLANEHSIAIYIGTIERPIDRGGHSLYCSLIYIDKNGVIRSVHRKLMPTYEERLAWSTGDGHGLVTHNLPPFTVGGLNCWENWMPMARTALYAEGEDLHIAVWPGSRSNTEDITPMIAKEARSYVVSVAGLFRSIDVPDNFPYAKIMRSKTQGIVANGGSCIAAPDGSWLIEPFMDEEKLVTAVLDHRRVREERQNFDSVGHYSRPDVLRLFVNKERQGLVQVDNRVNRTERSQ